MKNKLFFLSLILLSLTAGSTRLFAAASREGTRTGLTISEIKDEWKSGTDDEKEGIYIQHNGSDPYLLAVIKSDTGYIGFYLAGPGAGAGWNEGDIKAVFEPADRTGNRYNVTWYSRSGENDDSVSVVFDDNSSFTLTIPGFFFGRTDYYRKIFPYAPLFAREQIGTGTGFLLNNEGYIATNYHVIDGKSHVLVRGINGDFDRAYPYTAVLTDTRNDIAILRPEVTFLRFNNPPYYFNTDVSQGASVFALGYPMRSTMGDEIKLTNGIISALSGSQGNPNQYQTTATVSPGNSGGPLFDERGHVIGINNSILLNNLTRNVNYAIKIEYVMNLIRNSKHRIDTPPASGRSLSGGNPTLEEITRNVKDFVYMIEVF